jgi:hypothetical protein
VKGCLPDGQRIKLTTVCTLFMISVLESEVHAYQQVVVIIHIS